MKKLKIAIVGFAEGDRDLVPWTDPDVEIWGLNMGAAWMPRWDVMFEMHDRAIIESETEELKRDCDHLGTLQRETTRPIYMLKTHPDIPQSVSFPIEEFKTYFGRHCPKLRTNPYVTSTFGYMLGLAIMTLAPTPAWALTGAEIQVYGVPLLNEDEYAYQRENATFFAGFAMGRGIRFLMTPHATWMEADGLYGYTTPDTVQLLMRLEQLAAADEKDYGLQFAETQAENERLKARAATLDGARQYATKMQKLVKVLMRGGKL